MPTFQRGPLSGFTQAGLNTMQSASDQMNRIAQARQQPFYGSAGPARPEYQPPQHSQAPAQNPYSLGSFDWGGFLQGLQGMFPSFGGGQLGGGFGMGGGQQPGMAPQPPQSNIVPWSHQNLPQGFGDAMLAVRGPGGGEYTPGELNRMGQPPGGAPGWGAAATNTPVPTPGTTPQGLGGAGQGLGTGAPRMAHTLPLMVQNPSFGR